MLFYLFAGLAGVAAWKMAEFEDRQPWPWAVLAVGGSLCLPSMMGAWGLASPLVSIGAVFVGLWILRARDDRDDADRPPGSRIVR